MQKSDKKICEIDKKIKLLFHIKPVNMNEEKKKVFALTRRTWGLMALSEQPHAKGFGLRARQPQSTC